MRKDFWSSSKVGVIGGGTWGTVLAQLTAKNCREVRLWSRNDEGVRLMNATRINAKYVPAMQLHERIHAFSSFERFFEGGLNAIIWALPSSVTRQVLREISPFLRGDEVVLHATKGLESQTMKRVSEILFEEIPCRRIGVISGPNLALEISRDEPAATIVASSFSEVCEAGEALLSSRHFWVTNSTDVVGVEWAGVLKNIFAIACGALDALHLGDNATSMVMTRGLAEMASFYKMIGAKDATLMGLAGVGDLFATCSTPLSRNYRVGFQLAQGKALPEILSQLGSTAEGIRTAHIIAEFAQSEKVPMPITQSVDRLIKGEITGEVMLDEIMARGP